MKLSRTLRRDPAAPTLRERAAALRDGLNRREAVLGAAVAATVPIANVAGSAEPHPDAALIALGQRWREARYVEQEAIARRLAIPCAQFVVPVPEALRPQDGDDALGIAALAFGRGPDGQPWYPVGSVDSPAMASRLRGPQVHFHARRALPDDDLPAEVWVATTETPWPERQIRADAIVAAWDQYEAETARVNEASGHDAADAYWNACEQAVYVIEKEIASHEARTLAGLALKARAALAQHERGFAHDEDVTTEILTALANLSGPTA